MNPSPRRVFDASALLAVLQGERGADVVEGALPRAVISAVNWSEADQKLQQAGYEPAAALHRLELLELDVIPFTREDAWRAADMWTATRHLGLSLGDRACLALAQRIGGEVLTADQVWASLAVGVSIRLIR